ncbi:MAG: response regulator [Deltaproteobacteria bacterium]|nr:MAG: response regulator [Deltaproteobacteria bacterium]
MKLETQTLTTGEVAKHCGVHFRTVIRWIEKGYLKAYQLPGRGDNRVQLTDFVEFLKKNSLPIPAAFQQLSKRVLIVDDEDAVAQSIQRTLHREGFETKIASDGFKAGIMMGLFSPTLITLDIQMPHVDGFEVIRFVRAQPQLKNTKILVVSGVAESELKRSIEIGADAYLAKPVQPEELVKKINELVVLAPQEEKVS